ncbi:ABC transporter substrate-binding protein [Bacillus aquiflavi]|uniref:ABC transporter substrate-binding protein n=1 Tax=Bacillus aquiflavi TaxID=2672567 RepID=UPI001CA891B0|nr:ABC transporter substrate-binding protein [Bacillus aquiflavi]UAC50093.1 ABC transporter substrate-binding protein [Bacillus aquiflavi]
MKKSFFFLLIFILIASLTACTSSDSSKNGKSEGANKEETLIFADAGWDSMRFHNGVARFILENGYGYKTDIMPGSTVATIQGLGSGDIDIYMEVWTDNVKESYQKVLDSGKAVELGINYDDNTQGLYVPTYVIEGDPERGIEPLAPDLKTVEDLKKYKDLFKDPEDPSKGRIIGAIPGWSADEIMTEKIETYGLDEQFNIFRPGSDGALSTSIVNAYKAGEPWVGYYWEPTWIMGMYDMTLLEEKEYNEKDWNDGYKTAFPSVKLTIAVNKDVSENKEVVDFLKNYKSSTEITNEALSYMQEHEATAEEAAENFLKEHEELWVEWVPEDIANKVKEKLS